MRKKTKIFLSAILLILLTLTLIAVFVDAKKGGSGGLPCAGPILYTPSAPGGKVCYQPCGSPEECHNMIPGGKGSGCDFGQICNNKCKCIWVDKDLDGYDITTCKGGDENWMSLPQVDVIKGDYGWNFSEGVEANSFQLVQVKGLSPTKVYKLEFYGEGFQKTYDYSSEPDGYYKLSSLKKLVISFEKTVTITKIVVNWDDNELGNVVEPIFYTKPGSSMCDCDDYNAYIHPQAVELCDNVDNDCNGVIDEDDVCEKNIYACKTDSFVIENKGNGQSLSYGHCAEGEWCSNKIIGEFGSCTYTTEEEEGLGKKDFYAYVCDRTTCYKFTKGAFVICGKGWNCTAICIPGSCNFNTKEWCNELGIWQTEEWCQSECGEGDSTCEGNCEHGKCDVNVKKWCKNGYWIDEGYCECDICGSEDSSCTTGCTCENGACDTENDEYCQNGIWKSEGYCWTTCCQKDYDCYFEDICETCTPGTCDIKNNKYCHEGVWTSEDYCGYCECCDFDCGIEPCEDGKCDVKEKKYCKDGEWISPGTSYCFPGYCGLEDPSCECSNDKDDCCKGEDDGICDPDCLESADPDCEDCTVASDDCCKDTHGDGCDEDCVPGVDPDCQTNCQITSDDCCSNLDDGNCDPDCTENSDINCVGVCTTLGGDCCVADANGYCDPDCIPSVDPDCVAHPCEEKWVCKEWDSDCDGINDYHTCLEWEDKNGCNTFFDKPEDTLPCYIDFPCTKDDDTDGDGYPERACYDVENDKVLEELDCDDNDASQHLGAEEICNGEDDNCDDSVDEDCPCVGGATQLCGKDEGICKTGLQLCIDGYWSVCAGSGYVGPSKESCDDGLDNNCDGYVDENCNCIEGQKQDCGIEVGVCKKGWQACYNGKFGSVCNDEVKGVTEICNNNVDDDCDNTLDGDDSNCQVATPVTTGPEHCRNRIQDADETGVDCGDDKDCPSCTEKPAACSYGIIDEKCTCGAAAYSTGYCCNGKYSLVECTEPIKDSDSDGCNDDKELQLGTDPKNGDTDGDTLLDCDPKEKFPLCNEDGNCDAEKEYLETLENCPSDCGKGVGWLTWLILIIIILGLFGVGLYLYAKSKGYKLSDFIKKILGKKKEEKPLFSFDIFRKTPVSLTKPEKKRDIIRLREFANNAIKKGYTKLQVRQSALKAGWTEQEIDNVLKGKKSGYKFFK